MYKALLDKVSRGRNLPPKWAAFFIAGEKPGEMEAICSSFLPLLILCRPLLWLWALAWACGALSISWRGTAAISKSQKIQAEIDKVKAKISEQQARLKELEQKHREAENEEIVDIVRSMSVSLEELPLVLQRLRDGGTSGQSVQKSEDGGKEEN